MIETTPQPAPKLTYARFWSRVNAYGYDVIIVQLIALVPLLTLYNFPTMEQIILQAPEATQWFATFTNAAIAISAAYNILFTASDWQATPGKRHCNMMVVNVDGSRLTLKQSAIRHAASGISTITLWLGFLPALFTKERTTAHDMICKTRVIRVKAAAN